MLKKKVDFIGAGNVATRMTLGLHAAGVEIGRIASRDRNHAAALASEVGATVADIGEIDGNDSDMVIIAVNDDAIGSILEKIRRPEGPAVYVHTAGSVPMQVFDPEKFPDHGIFYPLQTMSRTLDVDWTRVPLFVESSSPRAGSVIDGFGRMLTSHITPLDSAQRARLHAAAVIGCNMAVYLWSLSEKVLNDTGLDFEVMRPLLDVTLERTRTLRPTDAMTGPARRGDLHTISRHIESLPSDVAPVYALLSKAILQKYHPELSISDNE